MRINIAASHRFHLLDLARELEILGHEVRFYSYVPTRRAIKYGLKKESSFSLFVIMLPFLILVKLSKKPSFSLKLVNWALDTYLSFFMKPCDVYIALGTVYKKSFVTAKKRFNAVTILEWGSKHIEEQQRILSQIPKAVQQDRYSLNRSLTGYKLADYIAIASDHVKQSFIERGVSEHKLIQNPYGVDLSMFSPTELSSDEIYDVIMVGGWRYEKGCDLLVDYFEKSSLTFLHVGTIINLDFPKFSNMTHIDSVDQTKLINYYKKAKVFVLPSRAEGLAMVQAQALACGLPIVCTKDTGGRDLRNMLKDKKWIIELEDFNIEALDKAIKEALILAATQTSIRSYTTNIMNSLDWKAYGLRYNENLENICINVK
ncbi:glycosyltransferase family 4 protein [Flavobacterium procerum]|uniref:Glycosyltransferase family 4 protein n=1 Tax=Flavobacterium procerum TaxID=1455569 RepID=A0ABV6BWW3_9FLAO